MKKINSKGFVLAETLVVAIFLLVIFTMIYRYYYPLIGEYEKRETYNDVDSLYSVFWLKKMIEDSSYSLEDSVLDIRRAEKQGKKVNFEKKGFLRFECSDISGSDQKREMCKKLVKELEVENCDDNGDGCNIFITKYKLSGENVSFKGIVKSNMMVMYEDCTATSHVDSECSQAYAHKCEEQHKYDYDKCISSGSDLIFSSGMQEYVTSLPDYTAPSQTNAKYRVVASFKHKRDNNEYISYATIEVNR